MAKQGRTASRKPTYGAANRLARIVFGVLTRPHGWSFDAIVDELGISERTLYRYLRALQEITDYRNRPLFKEVRYDSRRLLRLASDMPIPDAGAYDVAFLYFALSVFQFLDGTVVGEGVDSLWKRFAKTLTKRDRTRLAEFPKKFYAVPFAVKDYRGSDDVLDTVVQGLVYQHRLRIDYEGFNGPKTHEFEPYTLAMYRGGLYLIGRSERSRSILTLAVERIRAADKLAATFEYPRTYSPQKYTDGAFGMVIQPEKETQVELLLTSPETVRYVDSRRLHRTQRLQARRDGTAVLSMTVQATDELKNWVLSYGPYIKVLKPKSLRDAVRDSLARTQKLYD